MRFTTLTLAVTLFLSTFLINPTLAQAQDTDDLVMVIVRIQDTEGEPINLGFPKGGGVRSDCAFEYHRELHMTYCAPFADINAANRTWRIQGSGSTEFSRFTVDLPPGRTTLKFPEQIEALDTMYTPVKGHIEVNAQNGLVVQLQLEPITYLKYWAQELEQGHYTLVGEHQTIDLNQESFAGHIPPGDYQVVWYAGGQGAQVPCNIQWSTNVPDDLHNEGIARSLLGAATCRQDQVARFSFDGSLLTYGKVPGQSSPPEIDGVDLQHKPFLYTPGCSHYRVGKSVTVPSGQITRLFVSLAQCEQR